MRNFQFSIDLSHADHAHVNCSPIFFLQFTFSAAINFYMIWPYSSPSLMLSSRGLKSLCKFEKCKNFAKILHRGKKYLHNFYTFQIYTAILDHVKRALDSAFLAYLIRAYIAYIPFLCLSRVAGWTKILSFRYWKGLRYTYLVQLSDKYMNYFIKNYFLIWDSDLIWVLWIQKSLWI